MAPGSVALEARVLACLRSGRDVGGFVAVEGRSGRFRVEGRRVSWLGGIWEGQSARPLARRFEIGADVYEWTARREGRRVVRVAANLKGWEAALIGEESSAGPLRLPLGEGVTVQPGREPGVVWLRRGGVSARVCAVAAGRNESSPLLVAEGGELVLGSATEPTGRRFRAVLLCWSPERNRSKMDVRTLTVSEDGRIVPPSTALAVRIGGGSGHDGLVIYRSLGKPRRRAFLGHLTTARFLIGRFTTAGDVEPLARLDGSAVSFGGGAGSERSG